MAKQVEVFLDLDNVLVDFVNGACRHHNVENPYLNPDNHGKYNMEKLIGMDCKAFFCGMDFDFWSKLEWMEDGQDIVGMVLRYVSFDQITILTSPIATSGCVDGKIHWVRNYLPMLKRSFFIGPNKHKIAGPDKLLIDDHNVNVDNWLTRKDGTPTGGHAIQVPRITNRLHGVETLSHVKRELENYFGQINPDRS